MVMLPDMPPQMPGFLWAGFEPRGLRVIAIGFLVAAFFASCSASLPSTNQSAASSAAPGRQRCHCSGAVQGAATPSRAPFACERPLRSTLTPPAAPLGVVSASGAAALLRRAPAGCWPLYRLGCRIRAAWPRSALLLCAAAVGLATRLCRQARKLCAQPPGPTTPALLQAPHKQTTPAPPALGGLVRSHPGRRQLPTGFSAPMCQGRLLRAGRTLDGHWLAMRRPGLDQLRAPCAWQGTFNPHSAAAKAHPAAPSTPAATSHRPLARRFLNPSSPVICLIAGFAGCGALVELGCHCWRCGGDQVISKRAQWEGAGTWNSL